MKREEAISLLRAHADHLRREGIAHIALFGSVARDDAAENSDVDLIVEATPERPLTLLNLGSVHDLLEEVLGRPVDVIPRYALDRALRLRRRVAADIVDVF